MRVEIVDDKFKALGTHYIQISGYGKDGSGVAAYKRDNISSLQGSSIINKQMTPIRVMVDGSYVKVYVGEKRVANIPNADLGRSNRILFKFTDVRGKPIYVTDIRIAAGEAACTKRLKPKVV